MNPGATNARKDKFYYFIHLTAAYHFFRVCLCLLDGCFLSFFRLFVCFVLLCLFVVVFFVVVFVFLQKKIVKFGVFLMRRHYAVILCAKFLLNKNQAVSLWMCMFLLVAHYKTVR